MIRAVDNASGPMRAVGAAAQSLSSAFTAPARAMGSLVDGLGKIGLAGLGFQAVTGAARSLGDALGVGLVNEMEQVSASINAFTKDGAATQKILSEIRTEANQTPFGFRELATATSALLPVAKQAKIPYMELVKQAEILAASNPFEGLEGASFSLREAMTGDFTSIIERFNLSRSTINKLKAEGVPALEIVRRAMKEMGFDADLVSAKAQTLEGRWSTFLDTIDTVKMTIAQPIFDVLKEALVGVQGLLDDNTEALQAFAKGTADNIGRVITIFKALFAAFSTDAGAMGIVLDQIRGMFGDDFANAIEPGVQKFMELIPQIKQGFQDAFAWIQEHGEEIKAALIGIAVGLAALAIAGGIAAGITAVSAAIAGLLTPVGLLVAGAAALGVAWETNFLGIREITAETVAVIQRVLAGEGGAVLEGFVAQVQAIGPQIIPAIASWTQAFLGWIAEVGPPLMTALAGLFADIVAWIMSRGIELTAQLAIWGIEFYAWVTKVALPGLPGALAEILAAISAWIGGSGPQVAAEAGTIGTNLMDGIRDGIMSRVEGIAATAAAALQRIIQAAKIAAGEHSPSTYMAEIGADLAAGLGVGIEKNTFSAVDSMNKLIDVLVRLAREQIGSVGTRGLDAFKHALQGLSDQGRLTADNMGRLRDALNGYNIVAGTAAKQSEAVARAQKELQTFRLFGRADEIQFQQRQLEIDRDRLKLQEQMVPLLRQREDAELRLRDAQKTLSDARETSNKRDDKIAEAAVEAAQDQVDALEAQLRPYQELETAIQRRTDDLRREQDQWELTRRATELTMEAGINAEERLKAFFEAQAEEAARSIEKVQDLHDELDDLPHRKTVQIDIEVNGDIPGFAEGGIVPGPRGKAMLAVVHGGERVIPVGGSGGGHGGGDIYLTVNVEGSVTSEQDLAEMLRQRLIQTGRRNGYSAFGGQA